MLPERKSATLVWLILAITIVAAPAANGQQRPPVQVQTPRAVSTVQQPRQVFASVKATPEQLTAGIRTTVTVTAVLAPPFAEARLRAQLVRVTGDNAELVLAEMERTGRQLVARHVFSEDEAGRVALRVKLTPAASTAAMAVRPPNPVYSAVVSLVVAAAQAPPRLEAGGLRAGWPVGWAANRRVTDRGGPWSGNNFAGQYQAGGVVPAGGCEIEATSASWSGGDLHTFVRGEAEPGAVLRTVTVRDWRGVQADYEEDFGVFRYHVTAVYVVAEGRLFKIYLTHRAGDAVAGTCQAGLQQMLATFEPVR